MINNIRERFTDTDTIDKLAVLDLTGTDHLYRIYGCTEIEALAQKFEIDTEDHLLQWQDFIELINTRDQQQCSLLDMQTLFDSLDHRPESDTDVPTNTQTLFYSSSPTTQPSRGRENI